ncbi:hypothetical protein CDAR_375181 [Caerostris darwini]|uniref:Uncharacterized protein n=1 Tax=Caerostris darwini TaxID=1538125 RepID=A0AAV4R8E8_9ARAC|nr:hypothetical protein CDAR_375181 [Caerostris darwini]
MEAGTRDIYGHSTSKQGMETISSKVCPKISSSHSKTSTKRGKKCREFTKESAKTKSSLPSPTKPKQNSGESSRSNHSQQHKDKFPISKGKEYHDERTGIVFETSPCAVEDSNASNTSDEGFIPSDTSNGHVEDSNASNTSDEGFIPSDTSNGHVEEGSTASETTEVVILSEISIGAVGEGSTASEIKEGGAIPSETSNQSRRRFHCLRDYRRRCHSIRYIKSNSKVEEGSTATETTE